MAKKIEIQYYDGSSYEILYPYIDLTNSTGSIATSQVPNLSADKITSGTLNSSRLPSSINASTLGGYSYSQVISNAKTINTYQSSFTSTGTSTTLNWSGFIGKCFLMALGSQGSVYPRWQYCFAISLKTGGYSSSSSSGWIYYGTASSGGSSYTQHYTIWYTTYTSYSINFTTVPSEGSNCGWMIIG